MFIFIRTSSIEPDGPIKKATVDRLRENNEVVLLGELQKPINPDNKHVVLYVGPKIESIEKGCTFIDEELFAETYNE